MLSLWITGMNLYSRDLYSDSKNVVPVQATAIDQIQVGFG
jgi:hypothetical protein